MTNNEYFKELSPISGIRTFMTDDGMYHFQLNGSYLWRVYNQKQDGCFVHIRTIRLKHKNPTNEDLYYAFVDKFTKENLTRE